MPFGSELKMFRIRKKKYLQLDDTIKVFVMRIKTLVHSSIAREIGRVLCCTCFFIGLQNTRSERENKYSSKIVLSYIGHHYEVNYHFVSLLKDNSTYNKADITKCTFLG